MYPVYYERKALKKTYLKYNALPSWKKVYISPVCVPFSLNVILFNKYNFWSTSFTLKYKVRKLWGKQPPLQQNNINFKIRAGEALLFSVGQVWFPQACRKEKTYNIGVVVIWVFVVSCMWDFYPLLIVFFLL